MRPVSLVEVEDTVTSSTLHSFRRYGEKLHKNRRRTLSLSLYVTVTVANYLGTRRTTRGNYSHRRCLDSKVREAKISGQWQKRQLKDDAKAQDQMLLIQDDDLTMRKLARCQD